MNVEQVLDQATEIVKHGWMQRNYCNRDRTTFCSIGAIHEVYRRNHIIKNPHVTHMVDPAVEVLRTTIRETYGVQAIAGWNDEDGRTQAEVVAMFEKARAYAAEKGL